MNKLELIVKLVPRVKPLLEESTQEMMHVLKQSIAKPEKLQHKVMQLGAPANQLSLDAHYFDASKRQISKITNQPAAFKILNRDRSPFDDTTIWSLPSTGADGKADVPGDWKEFDGRFKSMIPSTLNDSRSGYYITNRPRTWMFVAEKPGVYEIEIGDAHSIEQWSTKPSDDFTVQKLRLLRRISDEELLMLGGFEVVE